MQLDANERPVVLSYWIAVAYCILCAGTAVLVLHLALHVMQQVEQGVLATFVVVNFIPYPVAAWILSLKIQSRLLHTAILYWLVLITAVVSYWLTVGTLRIEFCTLFTLVLVSVITMGVIAKFDLLNTPQPGQ